MKIKGWIYLLLISIMVTVFPIALSQGEELIQKAREISCQFAFHSIQIDGLLIEPEWEQAGYREPDQTG